jgi:hypothetical protein
MSDGGHGISSGTISNVIAIIVLAAGVVGAYVELAKQQSAALVVNGFQDAAIGELKANRDEAFKQEVLQRLTAIETKIDADAPTEEKKRRKR